MERAERHVTVITADVVRGKAYRLWVVPEVQQFDKRVITRGCAVPLSTAFHHILLPRTTSAVIFI